MAVPRLRRLLAHAVCRAFSRAWANTGNRMAARIATIAITTSSSISVNAVLGRWVVGSLGRWVMGGGRYRRRKPGATGSPCYTIQRSADLPLRVAVSRREPIVRVVEPIWGGSGGRRSALTGDTYRSR